MNCIYSVSSAFTYSEFQKAKINGQNEVLENFFFRKISLYLLGHLQANNQRSEKNFSLIRNFKGVKFNRLRKNLRKVFLSTNKTLG